MNILALDSTAKTASAAMLTDGRVVAEFFVNNGKTHSEILLPMAEDVAARAHIPLSLVDYFAVTVGPGSFTGVRIGAAGQVLCRGGGVLSDKSDQQTRNLHRSTRLVFRACIYQET